MRYLVEQGLYAYFSHKADEYGVYFFDPLYYEQTEPFHANLRIVTNAFSNEIKCGKGINIYWIFAECNNLWGGGGGVCTVV